jgi:proline iminopeptidase
MLQNDVLTRLSHHRQIVFYDQRGTGKSKNVKPDASWGMGAQVADMEAVRAKLGFQKFDLVGDSYGGLLAMAYAAAHPKHIEKLLRREVQSPGFIYKAIPGAKFIVFEKSGHLPSYEEPDKYVQVVEEFLGQP